MQECNGKCWEIHPRLPGYVIPFIFNQMQNYFCFLRYRVTVADDVNQTGRHFHLASIQFSTSKSDVLMRLTVLNNNDEVVSVEGKGSVVLPAFLFMRDVSNTTNNVVQPPPPTAQPSSRPTSKTGGEMNYVNRIIGEFVVGFNFGSK